MSQPPAPHDCQISPEVVMERREAHPLHFLLKIESVSLLLDGTDEKYESLEFQAGDHKWRLIIYPNGISNKGRGGYVSLYLAMASTSSLPADWELNVVFNILLFDQIHDNYVSVRGSQRRFTALKHEWGFPKFITKASLKEPSNGYVMNDICVVGAEVFVTKSERTIECLSLLSGGSPYVQKWEIPEFSKLGLVWTSEEFIAGNHKWTINLYPKGNGGGKGKNVSVYLSCIDAKASAPSAHDKKVKVNFSLSIKNQFNSKRSKCHASDHWFSSSASAWGWSHFISLDDFNDPNTGFLVKDRCTVQVEISVKGSPPAAVG
ncbi:uncharacterized protein LOC105171972 [Sesamum indicum]|uniref:Uncharacterized protein LOC105171972 n=1 Tax=Sesamum indicum TaxID=4182 RepID=A0A6I9U4A9_SESIN|nr:uncharacterized protein LOC105171972 [Sesamum indicum]